MSTPMTSALPYEEPNITTILIDSSFLLLLNLINHVLDRWIYCGLLGQILIGVAWGTPGAKLLGIEEEATIVNNLPLRPGPVHGWDISQFAKTGLGGLSTSFPSLKANVYLSTVVAVTGIGLPMGLSFSLLSLASATPLQAFAAGAALCSTSLGTTFTILGTTGLTATRLGTVLTSAAMMDDVVGLVLVQVISNLGTSGSSFDAVTVVRPIVISIGLVIVLLLFCHFAVRPSTLWLHHERQSKIALALKKATTLKHSGFMMHTIILLGLVAGATFAGTSGLFAAYLAGASVNWWDTEVFPALHGGSDAGSAAPDTQEASQDTQCTSTLRNTPGGKAMGEVDEIVAAPVRRDPENNKHIEDLSRNSRPTCTPKTSLGMLTYQRYYLTAVNRILKPFFFASIGFSIPITQMFQGGTLWRGVVYTILMVVGKLLTGMWLVRFSFRSRGLLDRLKVRVPSTWRVGLSKISLYCLSNEEYKREHKSAAKSGGKEKKSKGEVVRPEDHSGEVAPATQDSAEPQNTNATTARPVQPPQQSRSATNGYPEVQSSSSKPLSLYPASIIGAAMVSRGEIGFLIASIAETNVIFSSTGSPSSSSAKSPQGSSEIYLIVTWAIVLCTVVGPLAVGLLVRRVLRLQRGREETGGRSGEWVEGNPLGVWGVRHDG
ncbi:MAG: hypothetical protein M1837_004052 [Sclerophora amabilis]|nr:MAG: hypothetical protein M1837_004052 [Sclerophora amabilis]